jgi:ABC-type transport system substrate-binding protein
MRLRKIVLVTVFVFLTLTMLSNGTTVQAAKPADFFFVHVIAPTSNPVRMQYAQLIEKELPKIGIGAELDLISWAALGPRVTDQEVGSYADGGYDISFFGMSMGTPATHQGDNINGVFGKESIPPYGYNVMYWSDEPGQGYNDYRAADSEALILKINTNLNMTEAVSDFIEWQKIWYDSMPMLVIYNQYEVHAISKGLYGYNPNSGYPGTDSYEDIWLTSDYTGAADTIVVAASTGATTLNQLVTTDVYSNYASGPVMDSLYGLTAPKETILPTTGWGSNRTDWMLKVYGQTAHSQQYARMADGLGGYTPSGPKMNKEYNVTVKDDVYWHDGHKFDAWDVAFTFQAVLTPLVGCPEYSSFLIPFGEDDKANHHGNYSFIVEDKDSPQDGHFESISFQLNQTYGALELHYIGGYPIMPEHILGNNTNHGLVAGDFDPVATWKAAPLDWKQHSFNTGRSSDPGGLVGPIGTGAMVFKSFNPTTSEVNLEKFEDIKWDGSDWVATPGFSHYNIGILENMTEKVTIIVASLDGGLADMKDGDVNILDPQFTMSSIWEELSAESATINSFNVIETGWQALYFNPKFVQDNVYHLQKKGVRHAVSHVIPRDDIVEYLLNGLGIPAYTPTPVTAQLAGLPATIPAADMVAYKKTLEATDGSTPLSGATTAHDKYSLTLAFDWLDTEGYDTTAWRAYEEEARTEEEETEGAAPGFGLALATLTLLGVSAYIARRRRK